MKQPTIILTAILMAASLLISCSAEDGASQSAQKAVPSETTTATNATATTPLITLSTMMTRLSTRSTAEPVNRSEVKKQWFDSFILSLGSTPMTEAKEHIGEAFTISGEVIEREGSTFVLGSDTYPDYRLEFHTEPDFASDLPKDFAIGQGLEICGRLTAVSGKTLIFERAVFSGWSRTPQTSEINYTNNTIIITRRTLETYYTVSFPAAMTTTKTSVK